MSAKKAKTVESAVVKTSIALPRAIVDRAKQDHINLSSLVRDLLEGYFHGRGPG